MEFLEKRDRDRLNLESRVHAIGWSGFYNAFGGKVNYTELLPFPDQLGESANEDEISSQTFAVIRRLHSMEQLPRHVLIAIAQVSPRVAIVMQKQK